MSQLRRDVLAPLGAPGTGADARRLAVKLLGEDELIQSAFANLVDNAAKYTPPEVSLQIALVDR